MSSVVFMNNQQMMLFFISKILLGYEKALWPKKLEISHTSQILTNERQILVLFQLSNYYCNSTSLIKTITLINFKIGPALMAGCTVVCKPSEMTSVTAWMLCKVSEGRCKHCMAYKLNASNFLESQEIFRLNLI